MSISLATRGILSEGDPALPLMSAGLLYLPVSIEEYKEEEPHITDLGFGEQVKIIVSPRYRLQVVQTRTGPVLRPHSGKRRSKGINKSVLIGFLTGNYPEQGYLTMSVVENSRTIFPIELPYAQIRSIYRVTSAVPDEEGPSTLKLNRLYRNRFNLINVKF